MSQTPRGGFFVYARRSTDDADNQQNSLEYQVPQCLRLARDQGLTIADETERLFCTNGIIRERHTAYVTNPLEISTNGNVRYEIDRPKFGWLVGKLATGRYAGVIALCSDRLTRNDEDSAVINALQKRGIDIRYVTVNYQRNSAGQLHQRMDQIFNAYRSAQSSEMIRSTYEKLRTEGHCTYQTPVGYLDGNGPRDKRFDPQRGPLVRRLFELYATGDWSIIELARLSNDEGLTMKPRRRRRTYEETQEQELSEFEPVCRPMTFQRVQEVLRNPFYIGKLRHKGNLLPGNHPPLIDETLFYRVQQLLSGKRTSVHYADKSFFAFRGFVRCRCSRLYTPYMQKGRAYYSAKCLNTCTSQDRNLSEQEINATISRILRTIWLKDDELEKIARVADKAMNTDADDGKKEALKRTRSVIERDLRYLEENKITLLREGVYSPEQFQHEERRLNGKLLDLAKGEESFRTSANDKLASITKFSELLKLAQQTYELSEAAEKRTLALAVFSELVFFERECAEIRAKSGFSKLLNRSRFLSGGPDIVFSELEELYQESVEGRDKLERLLRTAQQ